MTPREVFAEFDKLMMKVSEDREKTAAMFAEEQRHLIAALNRGSHRQGGD